MSQIFKAASSAPGIVFSVEGTAPIQINGVSGVPQIGNVIVSITGGSFVWEEKLLSFIAEVEHGYFLDATLTATLPDGAGLTIGNTIKFFNDAIGTVTLQAGLAEAIQIGSQISTFGGTVFSSIPGSTLELVFKPTDNVWHSMANNGGWVVVE